MEIYPLISYIINSQNKELILYIKIKTHVYKLLIQSDILKRFKYFNCASSGILLAHEIVQYLRRVIDELIFCIDSERVQSLQSASLSHNQH